MTQPNQPPRRQKVPASERLRARNARHPRPPRGNNLLAWTAKAMEESADIMIDDVNRAVEKGSFNLLIGSTLKMITPWAFLLPGGGRYRGASKPPAKITPVTGYKGQAAPAPVRTPPQS